MYEIGLKSSGMLELGQPETELRVQAVLAAATKHTGIKINSVLNFLLENNQAAKVLAATVKSKSVAARA